MGLVIETRPDEITPAELAWLRRLGVTKVQMGAQSLDDRILALNQRGHTVAETRAPAPCCAPPASRSSCTGCPTCWAPRSESTAPILPACGSGLLPGRDQDLPHPAAAKHRALYAYWQRGEYTPYTTDELVELIADIKPTIPAYCRVNRVIRDIPSTHVVEGNRRTSLRQDMLAELDRRGQACRCIRCREVRGQAVTAARCAATTWSIPPGTPRSTSSPSSPRGPHGRLPAPVAARTEVARHRAGGPGRGGPDARGACLRAVAGGGRGQAGAAQHAGLGTRLLQQADEIARAAGYRRLAVIAAVGTRGYYASRGFTAGELYHVKTLKTTTDATDKHRRKANLIFWKNLKKILSVTYLCYLWLCFY